MTEPLLRIRDLCVDYVTDRGPARAIDRVSLDLMPGEILGIAGESGCGKSTLAQAVMRILPPPAVIRGGSVHFEGRDVLRMNDTELREMRWKRMSMVFQSAMDSLNPVVSLGEQIEDTLIARIGATRRQARERAVHLLEMVGIPSDRLGSFPHQLSGGMRQRVGIALALALKPSLVILDEPTTALDVIVEREILEQIHELQRELGFAVLFITHDLSRMLQFSDRVAIFYAAQLVEIGTTGQIREEARHPYTQGLLRAFPTVSGDISDLRSIPGSPPSLRRPPSGCRFHPRCDRVTEECRAVEPARHDFEAGHSAHCHHAE